MTALKAIELDLKVQTLLANLQQLRNEADAFIVQKVREKQEKKKHE